MAASIWAPGTAVTASGSIAKQAFTATAAQTLFTLTAFTYEIGTGSIAVFVSGLKQRPGVDFTETSVSSFTLDTPVAEGTIVFAEAFTELTSEIPVVDANPATLGATKYVRVDAAATGFEGRTAAQVAADISALSAADIGVSVQEYSDTVSQVDAEAGTSTDRTTWTAERVAQAIAALAPAAPAAVPTGTVLDYVGSSAPTGYVLLSGRTIGNGTSNSTERANADTSDLFTLIWNNIADTEAPVLDSAGTPVARGANAAADFANNRRITLPDGRGRVVAGKDDMGGSTASRITNAGAGIVGTTLGVAGGSQTHTLTTAQLASHAHGDTTYFFAGGGTIDTTGGASAFSTGSGSTSAAGSGDAHNNTQPTLILNKIIKL